ncbi:MAG: hypothetical protein IPO87_04675 [Flavobacteriales bacterium]|nr:hypothetical protein [Flavobacteriales bacterium]
MRRILTLLTALPFTLLAQTTWQVDVGGSTLPGNPDPYYAPQDLVIQLGDIVEWDESSGTHNVDGRTQTFPNNPATFYSGTTQNTTWPFSHTFLVPGFYEYHCNQQGHSLTQFGSITVIDPNGVQSYERPNNIVLFPIPADDVLMVALNGCTGVVRGEVVDLNGHVVKSQRLMDARTNPFDLSGVAPGQYFLLVYGSTGKPLMRAFVKGS